MFQAFVCPKNASRLHWSNFEQLQLPGALALALALTQAWCSHLGSYHAMLSCSIMFSRSLQHLDAILQHLAI